MERNEEIHDRDDEEEDSDLGLESDLALNGFEILETLPPFDSKSLPETPRSPPPPPASERGRGGGGLLDLRDRRWLLFSSTAIEAARERRRSWRQEAHTPPVLVRSTVCLLHLIGEKEEKTKSLFLESRGDAITCKKNKEEEEDLVVKILSSSKISLF